MRRICLFAALALVVGCSDESATGDADGSGGSASGSDTGGDWDVEDPPHYVYDDSKPPWAELPEDESTWPDLPMPLPQMGEDNGDQGITYSFALTGYYIMRTQRDPNTDEVPFGYLYDPVTDAWGDGNSVHRQCGATFTQAWLMRITRRPEFTVSTRAAILDLLDRASTQGDGSLQLIDLGATGLLALSLTQYASLTGSDEFDEQITGVGAYILDKLAEDGSFTEGSALVWAQMHQSMWRLWEYTGDEAYLDGLEAAGKYHHTNMDDTDDLFQWPYLYGLWAHEPLTELYGERPGEWIPELVFFVADDVISKQWTPDNTDNEDWLGGYYANPPNDDSAPNWNSTLKLEATIDAWRLANILKDEDRMRLYRRSAIIGAQFLQRRQFRKGETDDYPNPSYAVGGIPLYEDDPRVRIDIPHHGGNAMMKVAEYLDLEDFPGEGM